MKDDISSAGDTFIEAFARRMADLAVERLLERLRDLPGFGAPLYATAKSNPLGSRKAFLAACRRGDFKTFRRGREFAARWRDVETWMMQTRNTPRRGESTSLAEELSEACKPARPRRGARAA